MIKYGLISETDARCLEKTIDLICEEFHNEVINYLEVGVYSGMTAAGCCLYLCKKGVKNNITGIDNFKDNEKPIYFPKNSALIQGNSNEVCNQIEDNSQHLIFIDGCHCFAHVVSDFFCYAPKIKVGGYMAFHDTGKHIKQFKDFQHGDKDNPDAYISVRKSLDVIGLLPYVSLDQVVEDYLNDRNTKNTIRGWELIFDEADPSDEAGGICVFKKLY